MANQIGNRSPGGLFLRALSSVSDTKYEIVHSKFESVDFFCGQKSNVDKTELFDSLSQRRKHPNHMLPSSYHPSISGNRLLNDQTQSSQKSADSPDDPVPSEANNNQVVVQIELPGTEEPVSPEDPIPESVTNLDMSLKTLYGVDPENQTDNNPNITVVEPAEGGGSSVSPTAAFRLPCGV